MRAQPLRQVERIFHLVAELGSSEREELLEELCADDIDLRSEVNALLVAHDGSSILDKPLNLGGISAGPPRLGPPMLVAGDVVGPYRIVRTLGSGGMGVVYLAKQKLPVERQVALKLMHPGHASGEVLRRFESERQALALLDSPNIARILDAGSTEDGRPYFTMEYVDGVSITRYADEQRLTLTQRMELFLQVCVGIRHAHQRGIVHRDIKPSNILVTETDGVAITKIIDFGVARILQPTTAAGGRTLHGVVLGTPEYMSPEQYSTGGRDVDTRSDVYSAGVLLYELLVGELPHTRDEMEEDGGSSRPDTPLPSERVTSLAGGGASQAESRKLRPTELRRLLRGELDWICLRALETDREARYQTIGAFADDIQRALRNEAVVAGPPSTSYRLRKFARRHRVALGTAMLVLASLVATTAVSSLFYFREQTARREAEAALTKAEAARRRTEAVSDFARKTLAEFTASRSPDAASGLNEALSAAIDLVESDPELDVQDRAAVRLTLAAMCMEQGESDAARRLLERARDGFEGRDGVNAFEYADCLLQLAALDLESHDDRSATAHVDRALELSTGPRVTSHERSMVLIKAGQYIAQTDDLPRALQILREAREHARGVEVLEPARESFALTRTRGLMTLFRGLVTAGQLLEGRDVLHEAEQVVGAAGLRDRSTGLEFHKARAMIHARFWDWQAAANEFDSLSTLYAQVLGEQSPTTVFYTGRHAEVLAHARRFEEAESRLASALAISQQESFRSPAVHAKLVLFQGEIRRLQGQLDLAQQDYDTARAQLASVYPQGNATWSGRLEHGLGLHRLASGDLSAAEQHLARAYELRAAELGERSFDTLETAHHLADVRVRRGALERAEELALATHAYREASLGPNAAPTIASTRLVERLYQDWSRPDALARWRSGRQGP